MLVASPLGVKIIYSGLYLRVFRTGSQIFLYIKVSLRVVNTIYNVLVHVEIADLSKTHVKHKPCIWPSSPQVQCSSVVKASDRCAVGHIGSINVGDSDFFFVLCS